MFNIEKMEFKKYNHNREEKNLRFLDKKKVYSNQKKINQTKNFL